MNNSWKIKFVMLCLVYVVLNGTANAQIPRMEYSLGFSTFFVQEDLYGPGFDIYTDSIGNMYICGCTIDESFPATPNAYQKKIKGKADAFVAKFSSEGKLIFATLIGGSKREHHVGLTVDNKGYIYLVGGTHSADFPTTPHAYDTTFNGEKDWGGDVYLVKLDPTGSKLIFSTFIGGSAQETATSVRVDKKGDIIIGGCTCSPNFPTTQGAFDRTFKGEQEAFLAKFSSDGSQLLFSTFLGGSASEMVTCLTLDDKSDIYVAGLTESPDFPTTDNALRKKHETTEREWFDGVDQFLAKMDKNGKKLIYSTYYSGRTWGGITSLTWTSPDRLLIASHTDSPSFPTTEKAYCTRPKGGKDGFISIFNSSDMKLEYSTLFGGSQYDNIRKAFFLNKDCIVIGGETNSPDFPLTENALDSNYPLTDTTYSSTFLGKRKFFVSIINIKKSQLIYSTFLGGGGRFCIYPDKMGNLGFFGEGSADFPVTDNAFRKEPTSFVVGRLVLKNLSVQLNQKVKHD